jgi:hypothetical protein
MNTLYLLDTDNLLRAANPQTDLEVALFDRLHNVHLDVTIYKEALNNYSELSLAEDYPDLLEGYLNDWYNQKIDMKNTIKELEAKIKELEGVTS